MPKSPAHLPEESHLSRADIELLAGLKGNQEALLLQVNTIQLSIQGEAEARRKQQEDQRSDHNEQMKVLKTQIETIELWRATTITPERIKRWDDTATIVYNFGQRWKGIAWLWGIIIALLSIAGGWLLTNVLIPIFGG